jgi:hypothetical protein
MERSKNAPWSLTINSMGPQSTTPARDEYTITPPRSARRSVPLPAAAPFLNVDMNRE